MTPTYHEGNTPEEPGVYLIKYDSGQRPPFYIKAMFSGGKWFTFGSDKQYNIDNPEKIVAYTKWRNVRLLFGD